MNKRWRFIILFILWMELAVVSLTYATFNENIGPGASRALTLGNSITADPPGIMSCHYNPAGLSLMPEGKTYSEGFVLVKIDRSVKFEADPDFSILNDTWGPNAPADPEDPESFHGGPDPVAGKSGKNNKAILYFPIPAIGALHLPIMLGNNMGFSYRAPRSKWTFAHAAYAAYGGGFDHDKPGDPAVYGGKYFYLQHFIYAAPTVSYQFSDEFAVGLSIGVGQTAFGAQFYGRAPNEIAAITRVLGDATKDLNIPVISQETMPGPWFGGGTGPYDHALTITLEARDDFTPSYNVGMLWRPKRWFSFGAVYQSETVAQTSGRYIFEYSDQFRRTIDYNGETPMTMMNAGMLDLPTESVPYQSGRLTFERIFPQRVQFGVMLRPIKRLRLFCDLQWANWSVWKEDRIQMDQDIQFLKVIKLLGHVHGARTIVMKRDLKDTWHWGTGVEFDVSDKLMVRFGYEKRPASQRKDLWDLAAFIPDSNFIGVGAGLKLPKGVKLDIGLSMLYAYDFVIKNNESTNLNSVDPVHIGTNPYTGLDFHQDLALYIASIGITKPFSQQKEAMDGIAEKLDKLGGKIKKVFKVLNPFGKKKKRY